MSRLDSVRMQDALFSTGDAGSPDSPSDDNVTDWCLNEFRRVYGDSSITKDAIWEYVYGVMHAPDWREKYRNDLRKSLPRVPLAGDFEAFRSAGRELMDLHADYERGPEEDVPLEIDTPEGAVTIGSSSPPPPPPEFDSNALRIEGKMRLEPDDLSGACVLHVNGRCRLVGIPAQAFEYKVSGRSPLEWAVESLRHKQDTKSGIRDDPNRWHAWVDAPMELIRHLRRLIRLGIRSAEIIRGLPCSLDGPRGAGERKTVKRRD